MSAREGTEKWNEGYHAASGVTLYVSWCYYRDREGWSCLLCAHALLLWPSQMYFGQLSVVCVCVCVGVSLADLWIFSVYWSRSYRPLESGCLQPGSSSGPLFSLPVPLLFIELVYSLRPLSGRSRRSSLYRETALSFTNRHPGRRPNNETDTHTILGSTSGSFLSCRFGKNHANAVTRRSRRALHGAPPLLLVAMSIFRLCPVF